MIPLRKSAQGVTVPVRVQPGAKKTAITGIFGAGEKAAVKLSLTAPPIDGRANEAIVAFFAEILCVSRSQVSILYGESSRSKVILVKGLGVEQVGAALARLCGPG